MLEVASEVIAEIADEFRTEPLIVFAEFAQFLILFGIIWATVIGTRRRRGFALNKLDDREDTVGQAVQRAQGAPEELRAARAMAAMVLRTARAEARQLTHEARKDAARIEADSATQAADEGERMRKRAEDTLATELEEMHAELREELVDLVAQATRSVMNEKLSITEQRSLIQKEVLASVADASSDEPARRRSRARVTAGEPS